jgi:hypothetical protein
MSIRLNSVLQPVFWSVFCIHHQNQEMLSSGVSHDAQLLALKPPQLVALGRRSCEAGLVGQRRVRNRGLPTLVTWLLTLEGC